LASIEEENINLSLTAITKFKISKKYRGQMDYESLVKLRQQIKSHTSDITRLISFKKETIEKAIFMEDVIDSKNKGQKIIRSYFIKERNSGVKF
jgi:hypothetical protein